MSLQKSLAILEIYVNGFWFLTLLPEDKTHSPYVEKRSRGVIAQVLECDVEVSEFELKSWYYAHFWNDTFLKGMNPLTPPAIGEIV